MKYDKNKKEQYLFGAVIMTLLLPCWFVMMKIVTLSGESANNSAVMPGLIICAVLNAICVVFQWMRWKNT